MNARLLALSRPLRTCLLVAVVGCVSPASPPVDTVPEGGTVLFVGNSLTASNWMPLMVQALAAAAEAPGIDVRTIAFPDFDLRDHVARGDAMVAIRRGGWTTVVLQQGPSTLSANRAQLRASAAQFAQEITKVGARPALLAVWPAETRRGDFFADMTAIGRAGAGPMPRPYHMHGHCSAALDRRTIVPALPL